MTTELQTKLERLKNHHTRYEMTLEGPAGEKYLVCYLAGPSHRHALRALGDSKKGEPTRIELIAKVSKADDWRTPTKRSTIWEAIAESNNGWKVRLSHRTQREAYLEGELPYVRHAAQQA